MLLDPRQCVTCPSVAPSCSCAQGELCQQISQSCQACATFTCVPTSTSSPGGSGVSGGAVAGAAIAAVLVFVGAVALYFLYRRRSRRLRQAAEAAAPKDVPASAADVLSRPDPAEKPPSPPPPTDDRPRVQSLSTHGPDPRRSERGLSALTAAPGAPPISIRNPFSDAESIQTTSSAAQGTNVIPIGLAQSTRESSCPSSVNSGSSSGPARPARAPDLTLNENETGPPSIDRLPQPKPGRPQSIRSYMTNGSYSSEYLNEAPMIVTQSQRQVFGVVKAEVIHASGNSTPTSHLSQDSLKLPSVGSSRPSIRSPLAASSFGPSDSPDEAEEHSPSTARSRTDPFDDRNEHPPSSPDTPSASSHAHGQKSINGPPRPASVYTNAGSVIDISSATRVNVGYTSGSSLGTSKSPVTAKAKLLSPTSPSSQALGKQPSSLQEQQQRALAHAQARAHAQGGHGHVKRISAASSVVSTATRADSILESFPFVPPSPISSRPVRSPPRSPQNPQFSQQAAEQQSPVSPASAGTRQDERSESPLDPPPSRKMLGMSTGSQLSTVSTGLGAFPFQIDSDNGNAIGSGSGDGRRGSGAPHNVSASGVDGRQRASLDTLALLGDISAYPLGYDKEPVPPMPERFKR